MDTYDEVYEVGCKVMYRTNVEGAKLKYWNVFEFE